MTMREKDQTALYREIGTRIRAARDKQGLTQAVLVQHLSLSRTSLVNIEAGRQQSPLHTLWDIARTLKLEIHDLVPKSAEVTSGHDGHKLKQEDRDLIQSSTEGEEAKARITDFVASVRSDSH
jgi:DNA-binding XRE family transcriptional regulator